MICAIHDIFTNIKYFTVLSLHVQLKKVYVFICKVTEGTFKYSTHLNMLTFYLYHKSSFCYVLKTQQIHEKMLTGGTCFEFPKMSLQKIFYDNFIATYLTGAKKL